MHTSFIRVGGLMADVPAEFYGMVEEVVKTFRTTSTSTRR